MKILIEEYGMMIASIGAAVFLLFLIDWLPSQYKSWSIKFIGGITGAEYSYDADITLEDIEKW